MKARGTAKQRNPVGDRKIPSELREAAEHTLGLFSSVTAPPNLVVAAVSLRCGQPGSRRSHRNEVARFDDFHAAPDDLQLVIGADVEVGQPDEVTTRMRANVDNSPHHDAFGARDHQENLAVSCTPRRHIAVRGRDLVEAGASDGDARGPHALESAPGPVDVVRVHEHIAVGIAVSPDGTAKPLAVAEVIMDLRVQSRFLSL